MLYINTQGRLMSMLDPPLAALSLVAEGSSQCVYPAQAYNVTMPNLCGNIYIDEGEHCDTGAVSNSGCNSTCGIEQVSCSLVAERFPKAGQQ